MRNFMPIFILRVKGVEAAIEVNGTIIGTCSSDDYITLPVSENGEYYIGVFPLKNSVTRRFYPVVRKITLSNGEITFAPCDDVEIYAWPNGMYELIFTLSECAQNEPGMFPYIVEKMKLPDGCIATLYYENGLKLAIEKDSRVILGTALDGVDDGEMHLNKKGMLIIIAGTPDVEYAPEGYGKVLLILNETYSELLRVSADAVGLEANSAIAFETLGTILKHEKKRVINYNGGAFVEQDAAIGFFTRIQPVPKPGSEMTRAFCEAVMLGEWDEAYLYLTPELKEGLTKSIISDCLGDFTGCRETFASKDNLIGLTYSSCDNGVMPVRVFLFEYNNGLIDNLSEEE